MNMTQWLDDLIKAPVKKALPVLSFPSVQLLGIGVNELIHSSDLQAKGMKAVAERVDSAASVSNMDLSVEAEAFGSEIRFSDDEVPTVVGHIIESEEQADALVVPEIGAGRTGRYIEAIEKASKLITDRPVLAGVIGPFSLAGRLLDVSEAMIYCYDEPDLVHKTLKKIIQFSTAYIKAYKAAGANGVVIAEPVAGLLSPALNEEFSVAYVKQIVSAVKSDDFAVIYHNCGNGTPKMMDAILTIGADAYHFGNAVDMKEMLSLAPLPAEILREISEQIQNGKAKAVKALVEKAIADGVPLKSILDDGLLNGMGIVGAKFKNNEVFVPEVLVAARAMNMGASVLKPLLAEAGVVASGKVCLGTVKGDLHDIGKNLVKMMMEGKGLEVIDLGTDVPPEKFIEATKENNCKIIACSALLTTTMGAMQDVVEAAKAAGIRDEVKIMIGGAPVTQAFCEQIKADCYTPDAASAAEVAVDFCKA